MHNILLVHVVNSQQYLLDNVRRMRFLQGASFEYSLEQLAALKQLTGQVKVPVVLKYVRHSHDVGVCEALDYTHLLPHELLERRVGLQLLFVDNFESALRLESLTRGTIYLAKATASKLAVQLILVLDVGDSLN